MRVVSPERTLCPGTTLISIPGFQGVEAVYLIGVEFNWEERNITGFQWEQAAGGL